MTVLPSVRDVFANLLEQRTGQRVSAARAWRIEAALRPLARQLSLDSLDALAARLAAGDTALAVRVTDALLNNETSFFRDMAMFDMLSAHVLPHLAETRAASRRLRIWSAGCSTGQEAYSLAIMFAENGAAWNGWTIDLLGTDVSGTVVARARRGLYSQFEIQRGLPVRTMLRHFEQAGEQWAINPGLRASVRFAAHNLFDAAPGRFDLVLCRNVLMYFEPVARRRVFERLAQAVDPGGMLMLGAAETVIGQTERFAAHPQWRGLYAPVAKPSPQSAAA